MLEKLREALLERGLPPEVRERIDRAPIRLNSAGLDDWGLDPEMLKLSLASTYWLYKSYFRVQTHGIEKVPAGKVLLIANHGGQLPLDAMFVMMSLILEADPPRFARGMAERWFPSLPFVSTLFMRCGHMVGDIHNCRDLLDAGQCVLVFPEGTRGSGKVFSKRYQLQRFGSGFLRLALEAKAPIVPVAVIGAEETYPGIHDFPWLAKKIGVPYIPVTPFFPFLGPLGMIPLPTQVSLRFGDPLQFVGDPDAPDAEVAEMVEQVRTALKREIDEGLRLRGGRIFVGGPG